MSTVNFEVSLQDEMLILDIARFAIAYDIARPKQKLDVIMDITAVHANGCPLKLRELLGARRLDFVHDVAGIRRHLDRSTGKLMDCFRPRFAA